MMPQRCWPTSTLARDDGTSMGERIVVCASWSAHRKRQRTSAALGAACVTWAWPRKQPRRAL